MASSEHVPLDAYLRRIAEHAVLERRVMAAIERIEQQRDASRLAADDVAKTTYQQDMFAAHGWAFAHALQIISDELGDCDPRGDDLERFIREESARSPEFRTAYESIREQSLRAETEETK